jgi:hypothetical protein
MMTEEEILKAFQQAFTQKKEIRLINTYKGLPISFPGSILSVTGDSVLVKVDRTQIVCMYRDHDAFVQGETFKETIKAHLTQIDLVKLEVILSYFEIPDSSYNDRSNIRVEPDSPISGNIKTRDARIPFRGQLADISENGMGIYIEERLYHPSIYHAGAEIVVEINLPSSGKFGTRTVVKYGGMVKDDQPDAQASRLNMFPELSKAGTSLSSTTFSLDRAGGLELHGTVVRAHREQALRRYRIGIRLKPNEMTRTVINLFVNSRQAEIINEIRAEYNTLLASMFQKPK